MTFRPAERWSAAFCGLGRQPDLLAPRSRHRPRHLPRLLGVLVAATALTACSSTSDGGGSSTTVRTPPTTTPTSVPSRRSAAQEAAIATASDLRTKLIDGGIACAGRPAVMDNDSIDVAFGGLVVLDCPQPSGHLVEVIVFGSSEAKREAARRLETARCGLDRPGYSVVEGATWAAQSYVDAQSRTSRRDARRLAVALGEPVRTLGCT